MDIKDGRQSKHNTPLRMANLVLLAREFIVDLLVRGGDDLLLGFDSGLAFIIGQSLGSVSLLDSLLLSLLVDRISTDGLVSILVDGLKISSLDTSLDETRELLLVGLVILTLELLHVVSDMTTEDVLLE